MLTLVAVLIIGVGVVGGVGVCMAASAMLKTSEYGEE
jgi:Tfp pilus assembly protein PilV